MMEKEQSQVISCRVTEATYARLKEYADAHGESIGDVLRKLAEDFAAGSPGPSPHPSPPVPQPGQALPAEIAALPGKFQEMLNYEMQMRQYVGAMAVRMGELQKTVIGILAVMYPGVPPPWALMGAVEPFPVTELEELSMGESAEK
jgi:hypothetical protein